MLILKDLGEKEYLDVVKQIVEHLTTSTNMKGRMEGALDIMIYCNPNRSEGKIRSFFPILSLLNLHFPGKLDFFFSIRSGKSF